jgi:class 3 adenylate cyclase
MAEERVQRRLAAILAADVVGYSRLATFAWPSRTSGFTRCGPCQPLYHR